MDTQVDELTFDCDNLDNLQQLSIKGIISVTTITGKPLQVGFTG